MKINNLLKTFTASMLIAGSAFAFTSCNKDNGGNGNNGGNDGNDDLYDSGMTITVSDITTSSANIRFKPVTTDKYIYQVIRASEFTSEKEIVSTNEATFKQLAEDNKVPIAEVINANANMGIIEKTSNKLINETEYIVYAYHLNSEGKQLSHMDTVHFKTLPRVYPEPNGTTFEINNIVAKVTEVEYDVVPSDKEILFFTDIMSKHDFEYLYNSDLLKAREYWTDIIELQTGVQGISVQDYVKKISKKGDYHKRLILLDPSTDYYTYTVETDENGIPLSNVKLSPFKTGDPVVDESISFEISVTSIGATGCTLEVTPSSNEVPYWATIIEKARYNQFSSDEEYMLNVIYNFGKYWEEQLVMEVSTQNWSGRLQADTEYVALAFGHDTETGTYGTKLFKKEFKTTAAE